MQGDNRCILLMGVIIYLRIELMQLFKMLPVKPARQAQPMAVPLLVAFAGQWSALGTMPTENAL